MKDAKFSYLASVNQQLAIDCFLLQIASCNLPVAQSQNFSRA